MFNKISRLYHTVKYLKIKQVAWRIINLLPRCVSQVQNHPVVIAYHDDNYIPRSGITQDFERLTFLSETYNLKEVGWDSPTISKLWRYNSHYFEFLLQKIDKQEQFAAKENIVENWIDNNSFGKGTGWESYPTSLRIINWIKWHWVTDRLSERAIVSLWNQVRWLESRPEYHLLGNHLFINAKALLYASAFFGLNSSSKIYKTGYAILLKELDEQFLSDGAHFELSPMYHSLVMEDLLDLISIAKKLPSDFHIHEIEEKYNKGISWLKTMIYTDNELAHFNDCANGIAPTYTELVSYAFKLNVKKQEAELKTLHYHRESGFIVFKDSKSHLIADIGKVGPDYLPGHAHADTLSFELAVKGERIIVNSGTSVYGASKERMQQRSTRAHSTVQIDEADSSEVWSGFRVGRRAIPFNIQIEVPNESSNSVSFRASHDGYRKLNNSPTQTRIFSLINDVWRIEDQISGNGNYVTSRFYLHPSIHIQKTEFGIVLSKSGENLINLKQEASVELNILNTTYHDEFGVTKPNKCIQLKGISPCSISIKFEIL